MSTQSADQFSMMDSDPLGNPGTKSALGQGSLDGELEHLTEIEGMPVADPADVEALSLPPYFTACPNPYVAGELSAAAETGDGSPAISAFAADIAAGKNDPLYFAHYYSTKVPPDAIVPFILHYTQPGDVVFDGFCGTGMTGVAAQLCGDARRVGGRGKVGARRAILSDLSPAAAFIAAGTNALGLLRGHVDELEAIVREVATRHQGLMRTSHVGWPRGTKDSGRRVNRSGQVGALGAGHIEYVVWSDVFSCSVCGGRIVYWDLVFRGPGNPVPKTAPCVHCGSLESILTLERVWRTVFDAELGRTVRQAAQVPVLINYSVGKKRFEKTPDAHDLAAIETLGRNPVEPAPPVVAMPEGFNTEQPRRSHGYSHVHHFFTRRNLLLLTEFWHRIRRLRGEARLIGLFVLTGAIQRVCRLNRYMPNHDRHVGPLSGTLYAAPLTAEIPATNYLLYRIRSLRRLSGGPSGKGVRVGTQSATDLRNIPDKSVDYIFTDPPFGGNLNYSELNVLIEAWLGVRTNSVPEAIVNDVQKKGLPEYRKAMSRAFKEFHRVLKPGRWITVEFHNSQNAVWVAIQEALSEAGFVIADVRVLDKKKGTTKQLSYRSAVKKDLVISAYRLALRAEKRLEMTAGSEDGVWEFVETHLRNLPVFVSNQGRAEVIAERRRHLLFDRMVAFHVKRGSRVPLGAAHFYHGLPKRFPCRDGMYFTSGQVTEYDRKRMAANSVGQLDIFVKDEESAIEWLRQQLSHQPQSFQELHPQFVKELGGWQSHEEMPELRDLLAHNFLCYEGVGKIPDQIRRYMSDDFEGSTENGAVVRTKAEGLWYLPDARMATDVEKVRERTLLKEFEEYRRPSRTKLQVFRLEVVRAGFKRAWQDGDYRTIIAVAQKIPEDILFGDSKLLMWFDQAQTRGER